MSAIHCQDKLPTSAEPAANAVSCKEPICELDAAIRRRMDGSIEHFHYDRRARILRARFWRRLARLAFLRSE